MASLTKFSGAASSPKAEAPIEHHSGRCAEVALCGNQPNDLEDNSASNPDTKKMSRHDVELQHSELLHEGFCPVERYTLRYRCFDGGWSSTQTREFIHKPNAVGVLAYDPKTEKVVLVEQFRIGAFANPTEDPWLLEIVAGILDPQDLADYATAAHRELLEEIGVPAQELIPIYRYLPSPGCSTEYIQLYCARVDSTLVPSVGGIAAEGEDLRIHRISPTTAFAAVQNGKIINGMTIIALQWLELNLSALQQRWHSV